MQLGSDPVAELLGVTTECTSRAEYEAARVAWLEGTIGCDATYFGAAGPEQTVTPIVSGVSTARVERCEAHADRYWHDRIALNQAALAAGGAVADHDALSSRSRDRMPFYREVVTAHGIRATTVALLRLRGQVSGCIFIGRTSLGARFGSELDTLRRALPVLSLGDAAYGGSADAPRDEPAAVSLFALTAREREVLRLLCRGWTNAQIAAQLGSSPRTVKNQVSAILGKTKTANRTQLVSRARLRRVPRVG